MSVTSMVNDIIFSRILKSKLDRAMWLTLSSWFIWAQGSEMPIERSYSALSVAFVSVWYAWFRSWNKAVAWGVVFLSGWYSLASCRYASLMSWTSAVMPRPSISYRVLGAMLRCCGVQSCVTGARRSGPYTRPWLQGDTQYRGNQGNNVNKHSSSEL